MKNTKPWAGLDKLVGFVCLLRNPSPKATFVSFTRPTRGQCLLHTLFDSVAVTWTVCRLLKVPVFSMIRGEDFPRRF